MDAAAHAASLVPKWPYGALTERNAPYWIHMMTITLKAHYVYLTTTTKPDPEFAAQASTWCVDTPVKDDTDTAAQLLRSLETRGSRRGTPAGSDYGSDRGSGRGGRPTRTGPPQDGEEEPGLPSLEDDEEEYGERVGPSKPRSHAPGSPPASGPG